MDITPKLGLQSAKTPFLVTHSINGESELQKDKHLDEQEVTCEWQGRKAKKSDNRLQKPLQLDADFQTNSSQIKSIGERAIFPSKLEERSQWATPLGAPAPTACLNPEPNALSWTEVTGIPTHYCFSKAELPSSIKKLEVACSTIENYLKEKLETLKEEYFGRKDSSGRYTNAVQKITPEQLKKLKSNSDLIKAWPVNTAKYIETYKKLVLLFSKSSNPQAWKQISINNILDVLFQFIVSFQDIHENESAYDAKLETVIGRSSLLTQSLYSKMLPVIQKSWALYMKAYEFVTKKEIAFSGILEEFTYESNSFYVHIFYTRDSNGFLFSDFISMDDYKIQENLYRRVIGYGENNPPYYTSKIGYFFKDGNRFQLLTNPLIQISRLKTSTEIVRVDCYSGTQTDYEMRMPPTANKTFLHIVSQTLNASEGTCSYYTVDVNEPDNYRFENKIKEKITWELSNAIEEGKKQLLHPLNEQKSVIVPILSALEKQEAYYVYLLGLLENAQKPNCDPEIRKVITYIEAYHQNKPLETIIEKLEESLSLEYTLTYLTENESEIEATIRKEQEARRDAVARGEHYNTNTSKKQSRAKNKQAKKNIQKAVNDQESLAIKVTDKYRVASRNAKSKLKALKESVLKQPTWKYRQFTKLLNEAGKALQPLGINMGGEINRGSHGHLSLTNLNNANNNALTIKETVVKPHGGAPVIHKSRFVDLLDSINNAI